MYESDKAGRKKKMVFFVAKVKKNEDCLFFLRNFCRYEEKRYLCVMRERRMSLCAFCIVNLMKTTKRNTKYAVAKKRCKRLVNNV